MKIHRPRFFQLNPLARELCSKFTISVVVPLDQFGNPAFVHVPTITRFASPVPAIVAVKSPYRRLTYESPLDSAPLSAAGGF